MGEEKDGRRSELQLSTGFALFFQQCKALLKKNALLSWRNKRATFLQLGASFFFIFLIFAVNESIKAQNRQTSGFKNLFDPPAKLVTPIPRCEDGYFIKTTGQGCLDFVYSPNDSSRITSIVDNMRSNNPERAIPVTKTRGFATPNDVDDFLLAQPMRVPAGIHFQERANGVIAFGIQTNSTFKDHRGIFEDPNFKFQIPLQAAAEREITRFLVGDPSIAWNVAFKEFAHPDIDLFSAVGTIGPTFLLAAVMFGFVIQMSNLVGEKELKLRQAMATMGLLDSAYWLTWLLWELFLVFISSILLVLFGMLFQFYFFLHNNFFVLFFTFFLFSANMTSFAFMWSVFVSKASSATTVGFFVFIISFLAQLITLFGFPYDKTFAKWIQFIWSIFPPNVFTIGLNYLGDATATKQDKGISWSNVNKCSSEDTDCQITMAQIFEFLAATFVIWFVLAVYFDNIVPDANGVRKPLAYIFSPSYWTGKGVKTYEADYLEKCFDDCCPNNAGGGCCTCTKSTAPAPEFGQTDDVDVLAEEELVKAQEASNLQDPSIAVQIRGLRKTFPGKTELAFCCRCKTTQPYHAVKGAWFNVEKDKLFCLLGPNGAGKTTTINCLTGIIPTTSGDAFIYGDSIRTTSGMRKIRGFMGVCPQFDILWESLSGREHLQLFGSIKGIKPSDLSSGTEQLLSQVRLSEAAAVRSGSYSGGMKRRLSVAIALIGDPKILFLDEPTTGMDPVTRRHVWDIIESSKKGRAIVLTTHSMEEADILGDRVAIMARGRLRCIGTSIHLKNRFGSGYIVNVSVRNGDGKNVADLAVDVEQRRLKVTHFFKDELGVESSSETRAYTTFVIPSEKEKQLVGFFTLLSEQKQRLGISDIQISLTTLEEVFLNISKQAELESAAAEGRFELLTFASGAATGLTLNVPVGAPFVAVPGTESDTAPNGMMVEVHWQQDDTGTLRISGHSELLPVLAGPTHLDHSESHRSVRSSFDDIQNRTSSRVREAQVIIPSHNLRP